MKYEILGMVTSIVSSVFMLIIVRTKSFSEASDNTLLIVLLLFMILMFGLGIGRIFSMVFGDEENSQSKSKSKNKLRDKTFIPSRDDFIGDNIRR